MNDLDYKWDMNKTEEAFDTRLKAEGFTIKGVKMFTSKMRWWVEKDGVELKYEIVKEAHDPELSWKVFMDTYDTYKRYMELKKMQGV